MFLSKIVVKVYSILLEIGLWLLLLVGFLGGVPRGFRPARGDKPGRGGEKTAGQTRISAPQGERVLTPQPHIRPDSVASDHREIAPRSRAIWPGYRFCRDTSSGNP